ncbi:hypothetical protein [Rickettsia conorii]|uniref:Uncharacterized protein n=1 Tax=Rickettsia conorii (strain ATCC VR-613 / Malish 7) TaxID=272944 RepID=Q92I50_RICCN|nr:hypothetical protein [Rickettsia conorii]AAL03108.1 unknown [Rickettsia conorii str. Malish 7]
MDIGDLVSPDFVRLVTINTSSPIYVSFSVPEKYLDRINKSQKSNHLALTVRTISDQEIKDGEIVFVDRLIQIAALSKLKQHYLTKTKYYGRNSVFVYP